MASDLNLPHHFERSVGLLGLPSVVFEYLDDYERLGAHMMQSSWMMAGSHMSYGFDDARGRAVGSRVNLRGSVLGVAIRIDEQVVERRPPAAKTWETVGTPRMLVLAAYRMGYVIEPQVDGCRLRVFIDYGLPSSGPTRLLGRIAGPWYARWCVASMVRDAARRFDPAAPRSTGNSGAEIRHREAR